MSSEPKVAVFFATRRLSAWQRPSSRNGDSSKFWLVADRRRRSKGRAGFGFFTG